MNVSISHFAPLPKVNINKPKPPSDYPCIIDFRNDFFFFSQLRSRLSAFLPPVSFGTSKLRIKPLPLPFSC